MIRICLLLTALLLSVLALEARGHGGGFRGPNGGVPPALRAPSDPLPPPPPPSDPPDPQAPPTGGPDVGPKTPPGDPGHDTPPDGGGPAPAPQQPPSSRPGGKTQTSLSFASWRFWWAYNNDDILNLKSHIYARRVSSFSPVTFTSGADRTNVRDALRPTRREVRRAVLPALLRAIDRPDNHEDVHGGALVARGKLGSSADIPRFEAAIWNRYRNDRGQRIDFGGQATESGVLALGLLPDLDAGSRQAVRRICLEVIGDPGLRTRERTWAAVSLGLQRDREAVEPLLELLSKDYANDNIPAGILAGLGLIGDDRILPDLVEIFQRSRFRGRTLSGRVRSFAGYALMKLGNPAALPAVLKVLKSRRTGRMTKRSAVVAAGVLGRRAAPEARQNTVQAVLNYFRNSRGDATGEHFALIALSQIGTDRALNSLLDVMESGKYAQRPFAALGLATHVFYRDRDAAAGKRAPMDADLRQRIVDQLIRLSRKHKDTDTRAAFMLSRGLVKDKSAIGELVNTVSARGTDPVLRGFCCVALGLIGDARKEVKKALRAALTERRSPDLRRDAATGLGLLRDADAVAFLLRELKKARSFAVQGQLITAIGAIGDQSAIAPLITILDDASQPAQARAMAAVGLGMIGDTRPLPLLSRLSRNYNYRASVPDLDELLYIL